MIRVGILEDDPDLRDYLTDELNHDDFTVAFASETVAGARNAIDSGTVVDLCLVDLQLPDGNGSDFIRYVRQKRRETKALVLTSLGDKASILVAFEAGANGYLLKDTLPDQIRRNIQAVIDGGNPISPQAATHLLGMLSLDRMQEKQPENALTEREKQVLTLFAKGMSYKETASVLELSTHTVRDYVKSIYQKLAVHSRNEAIYEAMQNGWLDL